LAVAGDASWRTTLEDPQETEGFARLVRRAVEQTSPRRVLDVGCGTGLPTLEAAYAGAPRVVGIDKIPRNVFIARSNIRHARLDPLVTAHTASWEEVIAGDFYPGEIDLVVANPPYVPAGDGTAVDGGRWGTRLLDSIVDSLHSLPGTLQAVALMFGSISDPLQVLSRLADRGFGVSAVYGQSVPFGRYTSSPRTLRTLKQLRDCGKAWFCDLPARATSAPHAYLTLGLIAKRLGSCSSETPSAQELQRSVALLLTEYQGRGPSVLPGFGFMKNL